ncbi:MAG: hypothetical protein H7Z41_01750 [Cytophagales bacterium]|nr:hypothetical protein [Armatimonadota bacterium]
MNRFCSALKWSVLVSVLVSGTGTVSASAPPQGDGRLIFNGKVASTEVRTVNGSAYVKLSDMAAALGMVVVRRGGSYEILKKGGANQVSGALQGKIGDRLFDGRWRFSVLSVQTPEMYTVKTPSVRGLFRGMDTVRNDEVTGVVRAAPGYKLVVIQCRVSNGQKSPQTFWLAQSGVRNALTDMQGESYAPLAYDLEGAPTQSKILLPGAGVEFPILLSVPDAVQFKDLVFTLRNNDLSNAARFSDVRVSLTSP